MIHMISSIKQNVSTLQPANRGFRLYLMLSDIILQRYYLYPKKSKYYYSTKKWPNGWIPSFESINKHFKYGNKVKVIIRKANTNELHAINQCIRSAFSEYIAVLAGKPTALNTDFELLINQQQVYIATKENSVIAVMVIVVNTDYVLLKNVAVLKEFQNKGIGKELLEYAEAKAIRKGKSQIRVFTNSKLPKLIEYWSRNGFKETSQDNDKGHVIVHMSKKLR